MFITSCISTIILSIFVYDFYKKLPADSQSKFDCQFHIRVIKCRVFNFFNQISHILFSGNFLVPFFAIQFGLKHAGIFKLISHICYGVTIIVRKIFGWTSDALLSQTKEMEMRSKRDIFSVITQKLHHVLYGIAIFLIINHNKLLTYYTTNQDQINWSLLYCFIIITLSESFFIPYEKFYIAEEKTAQLLIFNLFSIALLMTVISYAPHFSQLFILVSIISIRATLFATLSTISFYRWRIKPKWQLNPVYIATSLFISFVFFAFF